MTPRLSLVVIRVTDLAHSRQFYEALGLIFREEQHGSGPAHLACELGDAVFEIYPAGTPQPPTVGTRLGFRIGNLDEAVPHAANLGSEIISVPKDSPSGRHAVLRDPDGHAVELIESVSRVTPSP